MCKQVNLWNLRVGETMGTVMTDRHIKAHLLALLARAAETGARVLVMVQCDPGTEYVLERVSSSRFGGVQLNYRDAGDEPMCSMVVSASEPWPKVNLTEFGLKGRDTDGEGVEVRLEQPPVREARRAVPEAQSAQGGDRLALDRGAEAKRLEGEVMSLVLKAFDAQDKEAALALVDKFQAQALAEVLLSNVCGTQLFTDEELFELSHRFPASHPVVSLFIAESLCRDGDVQAALPHLEHSAMGGVTEARGKLAMLYLDGGDGIAKSVPKAMAWMATIDANVPENPADKFFFLADDDREVDRWPYDIYEGRWRWDLVCEALDTVEDPDEVNAVLDAVPRGRQHVRQGWTVIKHADDIAF